MTGDEKNGGACTSTKNSTRGAENRGSEALYESVEYPAFAKRARIEGRVVVQFVVDEEGNVQTPTILKGAHKLLNKAAIEAIKEQTFEPDRQRGREVKVQMKRTVVFQFR